jgi:hypothetical protein
MTTPNPGTQPIPLIFDWPQPKRFSFVFLGCVVISLVAHAATFFVFQVVYPQRVTISQQPPRVSLLRPSTPENIALLHWIEAEDPALAGGGATADPPGLAEIRYEPSYAVPRTAPLSLPAEWPEPVRFPAAKDPVSLIASASARPPKALPTSPSRPTSVSFYGPLASRSHKETHALSFESPSAVPLQPSRFMIGVTDQGEVRYIFLQESSGDPAFDSLASSHLQQLNFAASETPISWGFALFSWGDDAYGVRNSPRADPQFPPP